MEVVKDDKVDLVRQVDLSTLVVKRENSQAAHHSRHHHHEEEDILPSFTSLKEKTHQTIYGSSSSSNYVIARDNNNNNNKANLPFDKSPKGSVDERISPLVDLINHHDAFATLSSCSGRMALFDPNGSTITTTATATAITITNDVDNDRADHPSEETTSGGTSGKGHGRWLQVSHDPISTTSAIMEDWITSLNQVLLSCSRSSSGSSSNCQDDLHIHDPLQSPSKSTPPLPQSPPTPTPPPDVLVTFLFEPMVLHVAACNLQRGQELLQIALQCGFRESGLVVTAQRVTVAIRTHGLTMNVPFLFLASFQQQQHSPPPPPSDDSSSSISISIRTMQQFYPPYLRALISEGNARLQRNQDKLNQLYSSIQQVLFVPQLSVVANPTTTTMHNKSTTNLGCMIQLQQALPPLNLWGHAAVALPSLSGSSSPAAESSLSSLIDLWVFGGYGRGPDGETVDTSHNNNNNNNNNSNSCSQRSNRVYRLIRQSQSQSQQPLLDHYSSSWSPYWQEVPTRYTSPPSSLSSPTLSTTVDQNDTSTTTPSLNHTNVDPPRRWFGLDVVPVEFPKCQSLQACVFSFPNVNVNNKEEEDCCSSSLIILFGGRTSPSQPLSNLYLYHPGQQCFAIPATDCMQGNPPSPRWGHSMTRLSSSSSSSSSSLPGNNQALLVGGCTVHGVVQDDPIYLLSWRTRSDNPKNSSSSYLQWECLNEVQQADTLPSFTLPRFHHTTVIVPVEKEEQEEERPPQEQETIESSSSYSSRHFQVFVLGGLVSTSQNLLEAFGGHGGTSSPSQSLLNWSSRLVVPREGQPATLIRSVRTISGENNSSSLFSRFGASSCAMFLNEEDEIRNENNSDKHTCIALMTGGLATEWRVSQLSSSPSPLSTSPASPSASAVIQAVRMTPALMSKDETVNVWTDRSHKGLLVGTIPTSICCTTTTTTSVPVASPSSGDTSTATDKNGLNASITTTVLEEDHRRMFGTLVHHQCVPISNSEFVVLGGGASMFAFGDSFARSHHFSVSLSVPQENEISAYYPPVASSVGHERDVTWKSIRKAPQVSVGYNGGKSSGGSSFKAIKNDNEIPVLYVEPANAKGVKTCLERLGFLNKAYRMTKVTKVNGEEDDDDLVVLPAQQPPFVGDLPSGESSSQGKEEDGNSASVVGSTKRKGGGWIAVPVTESCWNRYSEYQQLESSRPGANNNKGGGSDAKDDVWLDLVVTLGRQAMPLATGQFARHATTFKKS